MVVFAPYTTFASPIEAPNAIGAKANGEAPSSNLAAASPLMSPRLRPKRKPSGLMTVPSLQPIVTEVLRPAVLLALMPNTFEAIAPNLPHKPNCHEKGGMNSPPWPLPSVPTTSSCIFLKGDLYDSNSVNFGDGLLCTSGALIRLRTKNNVGGASQFPDSTDTVNLSTRGATPSGSGLTAYYQVYYRNAASGFCPPETFNVSNGIIVTW